MTKKFDNTLLQSLVLGFQDESEADNLSVPTLKVDNVENLLPADSEPRLTGPKALNSVNSSSIRQVKKNLQLTETNQKIKNLLEEFNWQITNDEFLQAIFKDVPENQHSLVAGFLGHPATVPSGNWFARPYLPGETLFDPEKNNYFSIATFYPDSEGKYRRRKKNFKAQHVAVLDDICTKAAGLERLTLRPSYLLETSPGNYQAGYIFKEPIVKGSIADRLMKSIIAAGLCDRGADGPLARLARLPVGVNGKHEPPFKCRLVEWNPEFRYTVQELVDGLQLDFSLIEEKHVVTDPQGNRGSREELDDEIYIPRGLENRVVTKLKEKNLYLRSLGNGAHEIVCPFQETHTDALGGGAAYFEPSELYPVGGFSCLHGHCRDRHMRDLREYLGISKAEAKNRSTIRLLEGHLDEIVDVCEQELAKAGNYYQQAGLITYAETDRDTKEINFISVSLPAIVRHLSRLACFEKLDRRRNIYNCCDLTEKYYRILYDAQKYPHLPELRGIPRQGFLRPDGTLVTKSGYDQATKLFGLFDEKLYNKIPDIPSRQDAEAALAVINSLLDEFGFKTKNDRAAALSAILTAVIRTSLSLAPLFHVRAPQIASGKSYLTNLISAFATAVAASGVAFPRDNEECRKLLLACLITAPPVVCFDNMTTDILSHLSLCCALTEEFMTGRVLGVSKIVTVGTRTLFLSSGNNVGPVKDMTRRTITINLDPACETPANREFKNRPVEMVHSNRGYFVSMALTIIRFWIVSGRPITKVTPVATFTDWSDLCRQPLLLLGCPDPAQSIFLSMAHDSDREDLGRLLHAWYDRFCSQPTMIRDAINKGEDALMEVFMDIAGDHGYLNKRRLGKWIGKRAGRIVDGLRFEKDSSTRSAEAWRIIRSV